MGGPKPILNDDYVKLILTEIENLDQSNPNYTTKVKKILRKFVIIMQEIEHKVDHNSVAQRNAIHSLSKY